MKVSFIEPRNPTRFPSKSVKRPTLSWNSLLAFGEAKLVGTAILTSIMDSATMYARTFAGADRYGVSNNASTSSFIERVRISSVRAE